jgi:hypothetical protein
MASEKRALIAKTARSMIGWGYIYGATGWVCTAVRVDQQAAQYPAYADLIRKYGLGKWLGKHCVDCAQNTRLSAKAAGLTIPSGATSQWKADIWAEKGTIDSLPEDSEGIFLYRQSGEKMQHTGVCVGDGKVVEARGHAYGVIESELTKYGWTHWGQLDEAKSTADVSKNTENVEGGTGMSTLTGTVCIVSSLTSGTSKLNVRASASTSASKVAVLSAGDRVTCSDDTGTWAAITTADGVVGYCLSKYLIVIEDTGDEDDTGESATITLTAREIAALKAIAAKL